MSKKTTMPAPAAKKPLTKNDQYNLDRLPKGWFGEMDVWFIQRTKYCLTRLVEAGCVERKIVQSPKYGFYKYKKVIPKP